MAEDETELLYEDVLEYLSHREGDSVTVGSYPTFGVGGPHAFGLTVNAVMGPIRPVPEYMNEGFLDGQTGAELVLNNQALDTEDTDRLGGLTVTREWFRGATLSSDHARLYLRVAVDLDETPLYPAVGSEQAAPSGPRSLTAWVGWGFSFDFDGSPPWDGRWAIARPETT